MQRGVALRRANMTTDLKHKITCGMTKSILGNLDEVFCFCSCTPSLRMSWAYERQLVSGANALRSPKLGYDPLPVFGAILEMLK
jgi:hypothetical protein